MSATSEGYPRTKLCLEERPHTAHQYLDGRLFTPETSRCPGVTVEQYAPTTPVATLPSGKWQVASSQIGPGTSSWRTWLEQGWEPFAVYGPSRNGNMVKTTNDYGVMWFKRWVPA